MTRKTFAVETFKTRVNHFLATDTSKDSFAREMMTVQLENILLETGNYEGYVHIAGWLDETRRKYL